jgi:hypothetical protein
MRTTPAFLRILLNDVQDSSQAFVFAGTDYKVVSEAADTTNIQQNNVAGLFIGGGIYGGTGDIDCFQYIPPERSYISIP